MTCSVAGCTQAPVTGGLCAIHHKHNLWLDNSDPDHLGIVQFAQDLFPRRIDSKFGVPALHKEIYTDLLRALVHGQDKMDRLHVIAAPREHSKSTIVNFVYVLYCILFQKRSYIVIISESYEKTVQFIRAIKKALASPEVRYYFGEITADKALTADGAKWTEGHIVTSTGIHIRALGIGKSTRGLIEETRPDLIVADDIESENNTKTEESREANWDWWKQQVVPSADIINGQCVYIGTMVHYGCILARLFEQKNRYHKRFYQVYTDATETATIWPEKFPLSLVRKIREDYRSDPERGIDQFYREYMNIAVAPESRKFPDSSIVEKEFTYFSDSSGQWIRVGPEDVRNVTAFMGVDPAASTRKGAYFTAMMVGLVDSTGTIWLPEYVRDRIPIRRAVDADKDGFMEHFLRLVKFYRPARIGIEASGVGLPILQEARIELEKLRAEHPEIGYPVIVDITPPQDMDKDQRIISYLESPMKQRRIVLSPGMTELRGEMTQFPKSRYKDLLDSLVDLMQVVYPPDHRTWTQQGVLSSHRRAPRKAMDWETRM